MKSANGNKSLVKRFARSNWSDYRIMSRLKYETRGGRRRTLVSSIFHQPAGDADDILEYGFR